MARRSECAYCGRDVRGIPDAVRRFEGGRWYCSQSCLLSTESYSSDSMVKLNPRRVRHKWRRRIGWTFGAFLLVFVGLAALGAVIPPPSETTTTVLTVQQRGGTTSHPPTRSVAATTHHVTHRPVVTVARLGFTTDSGEIDYGITLSNRSRTQDATGVVVTVRAEDGMGRSTATATNPVSVVPSGASFNLAGSMFPSVSLKVTKLRVTVHVDQLRPRGLALPRVAHVRVSTGSELRDVSGTLTNSSGKPLSQNAPIYIVFLNSAHKIVGSSFDATGASVQPHRSVAFRIEAVYNGSMAQPLTALVSVDPCTFVQCLG